MEKLEKRPHPILSLKKKVLKKSKKKKCFKPKLNKTKKNSKIKQSPDNSTEGTLPDELVEKNGQFGFLE